MKPLLGALLLIFSAGCTSKPIAPLPSIARAKLEALSGPEVVARATDDEPLAPPSTPRNVLVLSGGGMYGAYTAGFLSGWTETKNRPEFDVVTGVSTGSLAGLAAFLGPKFDPIAREFYTLTKADDVYNFRAWVLVPWSDSIASSKPLKALIDNVVDDDILAAVAREHRKGRRLYVGTTHLENRRFVVWDMGAIARRGQLQKFRDVLLASCSVPGMMPPVRLTHEAGGKATSELHVDGGTTAALFVPQGLLKAGPDNGPSNTNVYIVLAGKLFIDPGTVRSRVLPVLGAIANSLLYNNARSEIAIIHHLTRLSGGNFHLTAVPESDKSGTDGLVFDPKEMTRLYEVGYTQGVAGPQWMTAPPFESSATDPPRE